MKNVILTVLLTCLLSPIAAAQIPPPTDVSAIRSIEETFRTAWLKNDETTIMSLFTQDAAIYPGPNPAHRGIEAIQKYWFGPSEVITSIDRFEVSIDDVHGTADFAAVTGSDVIHWSTVKKDGTDRKRFVSKGHFLAVYTKKSGKWLMLKRVAAGKTEEIKGEK